MLGFMGNIGAEVTANNAMPCGVVLLVCYSEITLIKRQPSKMQTKFLLDGGSNILFNGELIHSGRSGITKDYR